MNKLLVCAIAALSLYGADSRYLDSTIVDFGNKNPVKEATSFAKDIVLMSAKVREIPDKTVFDDRDFKLSKCDLDDDGGEACQLNRVKCEEQVYKDKGKLTKFDNTLIEPFFYLESQRYQMANDHFMSVLFAYDRSTNTLHGRYYNAGPNNLLGKNVGHWHDDFSFKLPDDIMKVTGGKAKIQISSSGGGCNTQKITTTIDLNALPATFNENVSVIRKKRFWKRSSKGYMSTSTVPGLYYYNIALCKGDGVQYPKVFLNFMDYKLCPSGYQFNYDKTQCEKDYTYFSYVCPSNTHNRTVDIMNDKYYTWGASKWLGPKAGNGDCKGVGLNNNNECPVPAEPSDDNCVREYMACPGYDDVSCYKEPRGATFEPSKGQSVGNFEFAQGSSKTYMSNINYEPTCLDGFTFDATMQKCTKPANIQLCPKDFTLEDGDCVLDLKAYDPAATICPAGQTVTPDGTTDIFCVTEPDYQDKTLSPDGSLELTAPVCGDGVYNTESNQCEKTYFYSTYTCPEEYELADSTNPDCKGNGVANNGHCNPQTPPLSACIKSAAQGGVYNTYDRGQLQKHTFTGNPLNSLGWGKVERQSCANDVGKPDVGCSGDISVIEGRGSDLCFLTNRGYEHCYHSSGCKFEGKMGAVGQEIQAIGIKDNKLVPLNGPDTKTQGTVTGSISSTCQMNGFVGNQTRIDGVNSLKVDTSDSRRIEFWDQYVNGYSGFIELVSELPSYLAQDGYALNDIYPGLMAQQGFSSIFYANELSETVFINPFGNCGDGMKILKDLNPKQWSEKEIAKSSVIKNLGGIKGACVISVPGVHDFKNIKYAVKATKHEDKFEYMCSPFKCSGDTCGIAKCPTNVLDIAGKGLTAVKFDHRIVPNNVKESMAILNKQEKQRGLKVTQFCDAAECDLNRPYVNMCGYTYSPAVKEQKSFVKGSKSYEYYCDEGTLTADGNTCAVKKCPEGTVESSNGLCKKAKK